jgi:hypothetical protein
VVNRAVLRAVRRYRAAGYRIERHDERGVLMARSPGPGLVGWLLYGWLALVLRARDTRVLITTNAGGRAVILAQGRDATETVPVRR